MSEEKPKLGATSVGLKADYVAVPLVARGDSDLVHEPPAIDPSHSGNVAYSVTSVVILL